MIVVGMIVTPVPVFLLLFLVELSKVPMRITVRFHHPLVVIHPLMIIPTMVVVVIGIVGAIVVVFRAADRGQRQCEGD